MKATKIKTLDTTVGYNLELTQEEADALISTIGRLYHLRAKVDAIYFWFKEGIEYENLQTCLKISEALYIEHEKIEDSDGKMP